MALYPKNKIHIQNSKLKSGFSLIELLVVVSIITILLGLIIASYINYKSRNNLQIGIQELRSAMVEASDYAFAPQHQTETKEWTKGYGIELNEGNNSYNLFWTTNADEIDYDPTTPDNSYAPRNNIKTYQLPNKIKVTAPAGQTFILFQVPPEIPGGKEIYFNNSQILGTITLEISGSGETQNITINCNTGTIEIE